MKLLFIYIGLLLIPFMAQGMMQMDEKSMIMNANENNLPKDCSKISETVDLTVHAGHKYAEKFYGKMFAFDKQEWSVKGCAKINVTFVNDDHIRHQFMIHGLPGYLYPDGMLHLELYGQGELKASFIVPSQPKTYLVHCELTQHAEKGMKAQLKVAGGDGDLPSIPNISKPIKADNYDVDLSKIEWAWLLTIITPFIVISFYLTKIFQNTTNKL